VNPHPHLHPTPHSPTHCTACAEQIAALQLIADELRGTLDAVVGLSHRGHVDHEIRGTRIDLDELFQTPRARARTTPGQRIATDPDNPTYTLAAAVTRTHRPLAWVKARVSNPDPALRPHIIRAAQVGPQLHPAYRPTLLTQEGLRILCELAAEAEAEAEPE
jgi:hypothetical protein